MKQQINYNKCLQELDREVWGPAPEGATLLMEKCHTLRLKPISQFTIEDLRILIGQQIGLKYLIPYSLPKLEENILAEGNYYEGDLLNNCLGINIAFWEANTDLYEEFTSIIKNQLKKIEETGGKQLLKKALAFIQHPQA